MNNLYKFYLILIFLCFFSLNSYQAENNKIIDDNEAQKSDNNILFKVKDDTIKKETSKKYDYKKSNRIANKALLLSLVLPGSGQVYVGSYTRGIFYFTFVSAFGYFSYNENKKFKREKELFTLTADSIHLKRSIIFHDQRNDLLWWFFITWVLNAVDSYINAHFKDFEYLPDWVSEKKIMLNYNYSLNNYSNFTIKKENYLLILIFHF